MPVFCKFFNKSESQRKRQGDVESQPRLFLFGQNLNENRRTLKKSSKILQNLLTKQFRFAKIWQYLVSARWNIPE